MYFINVIEYNNFFILKDIVNHISDVNTKYMKVSVRTHNLSLLT